MARLSSKRQIGFLPVVLSIFAAILLVFSLAARIRLTQVNDENAKLMVEYAELDEENKRLRAQYESSIDLDELEDYAKNVLGMQKPGSENIIKIDVQTRDKAVVLKERDRTGTDKLVSSIIEYLR